VLVDGQRGATAIAGVSEITVDATVAGDTKLRYQVDYGDGKSSTQASSKHVYASTGTFHVTATTTDAAGRTSSVAQDVFVAVVTGAWFQFGVNDALHRFEARRISIEQNGTQVRGTYVAYGEPDRGITGQLKANRQITLTTDDGAVRLDGMLPLVLSDAGYPVTLTPLGSTAGPLRFDPVPRDPPPPPPSAELRLQSGIEGFNPYGGDTGFPALYTGWEATFDATGSSGDGLSFVIDFGDGTFANTAVARHVVLGTPGFRQGNARVFVVDRFGRVDSETVLFSKGTVLNNIVSDYQDFFHNPVTSRVEWRALWLQDQSGAQITGTYRHPEGWTSPFTATLSGPNHIHLRLDDGTIDMDGTFTFKNPLTGMSDPFSGPWLLLTFRGGSADGAERPFNYYSSY
jgi:PKD repeat protein